MYCNSVNVTYNGSLVAFVVVLNFEGYFCVYMYLICVMLCKNVENTCSAINNSYNNKNVCFILLIYVCINYSPI